MRKEEYIYSYEELLDLVIKYQKELEERINKAIEFIETEYNTYPSAEEWRKALKEILKGDSNANQII